MMQFPGSGDNLFIGNQAGNVNNNSSFPNTYVGTRAGRLSTTGSDNAFFGTDAGRGNTTGSTNTFVGATAGYENTTGNWNTMVGTNAGNITTTGSLNTFVGIFSGQSNTTGSNNVCIGRIANVSSGNLTNANAIGHAAIVNASNKVRIGNSSITVIEGQVDWSFPSDGRFKFNIEEKVKGLDFIMKLRPVTYNFNAEKFKKHTSPIITSDNSGIDQETASERKSMREATQVVHTGFIAQEVEAAAKSAGFDEFGGVIAPKHDKDNYGLRYGTFVVPLVKAVQEQQAEIDSLKQENELLKSRMDKLETLIEQMNN